MYYRYTTPLGICALLFYLKVDDSARYNIYMKDIYIDRIRPEYYESIRTLRSELFDCGSSFDGSSGLDRFDDIEKWHLNCLLFERHDTLPPAYSIGFQYVCMQEGEAVGMADIRPEAYDHPYLRLFGGHIGYCVRPSRRKEGIGTFLLQGMLQIAKEEFELKQVLVTCLKDNQASKKVIMKNGGVYEEDVYYPPEDKYLERYIISL